MTDVMREALEEIKRLVDNPIMTADEILGDIKCAAFEALAAPQALAAQPRFDWLRAPAVEAALTEIDKIAVVIDHVGFEICEELADELRAETTKVRAMLATAPAVEVPTIAAILCCHRVNAPCLADEDHRSGKRVKHCKLCSDAAIKIGAILHAAFVPETALAAAPAVGGEALRQALTSWFHSLPTDFLRNPKKCNAEFAALMRCIPAAQPASPLRGREEIIRFMEVVRSRWNFEESEFDVIEKAISDPDCAATLSATSPLPAVGGEDDPFNRRQVEAVCRAVCEVEGVDPDSDVYGDGCDTQWSRYADAVAAAIYAAQPASPLRESEIEQLREWKSAILEKCKHCDGFDSLEWGGDKEGWGFIHYFIGHLNTRALASSAPPEQPAAEDHA
mgnify:CR=1 FL=1